MSDCCDQNQSGIPAKMVCPANGKTYGAVSRRTVVHHVKQPWMRQLGDQGYYFCDDPECEVVYFGQDACTISRREMRTEVGVKSSHPEATVCYCFGVTFTESRSNPGIKAYVTAETQRGACACEVRNPSGRCCLKDFPKQ